MLSKTVQTGAGDEGFRQNSSTSSLYLDLIAGGKQEAVMGTGRESACGQGRPLLLDGQIFLSYKTPACGIDAGEKIWFNQKQLSYQNHVYVQSLS